MARRRTTFADYPTGADLPLPWGSWVVSRNPQFKLHSTLGYAKVSAGGQSRRDGRTAPDGTTEYPFTGGVLYQLVEGKWQVQAVLTPGSYPSDHLIFAAPKKWKRAPGITTLIQEHPYV